jgi:hypothetical protein
MSMTVRMVTPLLIACLMLSGCEKDKKKITAEPVQQTDQRRTGSTSASSARPKQPPVSQPQERREQKDAMRDNRETAAKESKADSPKGNPLMEQRREEQTAGISPNNPERGNRKQPQSVTPLDQSGSRSRRNAAHPASIDARRSFIRCEKYPRDH